MPIGSAKIGVLGAGLVPGGTTTFNAPGTFTVPPGVKKVSITGKGGTGNPGNPGNAGNAGNIGNGGAAGGGGSATWSCPYGYDQNSSYGSGGFGGSALKQSNCPFYTNEACANNWYFNGIPPTYSPRYALGAQWSLLSGRPGANNPRNNAQGGTAGNSGQAGQAGQAGNPGQASSGLTYNFAGGAGGNAGAAGNAGPGGSAGTAGNSGGNWCNRGGGSGGTGAGNGGSGTTTPGSGVSIAYGGTGGGGAGVTNDGASGQSGSFGGGCFPNSRNAKGGNFPSTSAGFPGDCTLNNWAYPQPPGAAPSAMTGGLGGGFIALSPAPTSPKQGTSAVSIAKGALAFNNNNALPSRQSLPQVGGDVQVFRSGGGGGSAGSFPRSSGCQQVFYGGGGGGGGGRGGAAGAGGAGGSGGTGAAGTPQTFNCVPVTPGSPYPITVASPGGQVVISWNPQ